MSLSVNITKVYSNFRLQVSFETQNDILAILGASGCGKSLTLKCIAGIETPDEGEIILNGKTLFDSKKKINLSVQKRQVGYMFQNYALFPHMSVEDNIAMGLYYEKKKEYKKKRIEDLLSYFKLMQVRKNKPAQLSGGQQQRTALARVLAGNPQILLLDEPLSALDSFLREQMEKLLINALNDFEKDAVFVSHNRDEVYRICNRAVIYDNGAVKEEGEINEIFGQPSTITGAMLTGCKNIIKAEKTSHNTVYVKEWGISLIADRAGNHSHIKAIGIRAHSFKPTELDSENTITARVEQMIEEPFENTIYARALNATSDLCCKIPKAEKYEKNQILRLYVSPQDIYVLV